jgi:hypothetical protein
MSRFAHALIALGTWSALAASPVLASQAVVDIREGAKKLTGGDFHGTGLDSEGQIRLAPALKKRTDKIPGTVVDMIRGGDGDLYLATANPGQVWRVPGGGDPQLVFDAKKPMVTALAAMGKSTLVALSAPSGGAHFIGIGKGSGGKSATSKVRTVKAPGVKMLLGAATSGQTLYAVGGGEEGVLLRLEATGNRFVKVATVKEPHLRSVAASDVRGKKLVVVGGATTGTLYRLENKKLRAVAQAEAKEVADLVLDRRGRIFAALVDASGSLTKKGATSRDLEEDEDEDEDEKSSTDKRKAEKPRKVKSTEVLRVDPNGQVAVLWQSKKNGAYALTLMNNALYVGTGAGGRIYRIDPEGRSRAALFARIPDHHEVVALRTGGAGTLVAATARGNSVFTLEPEKPGRAGHYLSAVLDAEAQAQWGRISWSGDDLRGVKVALRTGNTKKPDDSWSAFSPDLSAFGEPSVPPGRYAQVRIKLSSTSRVGPSVRGFRIAHLVGNRAPEVVKIEILAPGWRVMRKFPTEDNDRSFSFSEDVFEDFLARHGALLPSGKTKTKGRQRFEPGWRTLFVFAEDPDKDALRYRFFLARESKGGQLGRWELVKDWSDDPFFSFESARAKDGIYRMKVEVSDVLTNGFSRALGDSGISDRFSVELAPPAFSGKGVRRIKDGVKVQFSVTSLLPLAGIRCAVNGGDWVPVDAADGIVDGPNERVDAFFPLKGKAKVTALSCEAIDEAFNYRREDFLK